MSVNSKPLVERGRFLRNAAPAEFDEFYKAFVEYTHLTVYGMLAVEGEQELSRAQGHAQQCRVVLRVLEEIKNG